ncbi:tail fiber domain-containing protein [Taibaiella helva]|uniref:tail fiber domain-containing protein n=1 Tax=Taibaiella helva TaxID=2301235 RepID=UPI000E5939B4|nr:tail fiber domain-containing protein [Taibaiella helva]
MKVIIISMLGLVPVLAQAQVGIGTTNPLAGLHVTDSSVLFSAAGAAVTTTATPISGDGRRMMWYAPKAAFRAGYLDAGGGSFWDASNIGNYSFAAGTNTRASGTSSFAAGNNTTASGNESVAMGSYSIASALASVALNGQATDTGAVAIGSGAIAAGDQAMALGQNAVAYGFGSVSIGPSTSSGIFSVAIGVSNRASNWYSFALGRTARSNHNGSFVLGDGSAGFTSDSVYSSANNQMSMRFVGGYRLFTNLNLTSGIALSPGGGSWSSLSDRRKKENFQTLDREEILTKVAALPLTSWNYKSQPATQRHIGPMAQDFYAAFQLDGIGNDTTINTVDIDGVNMAAIQALEIRSRKLSAENEALKSRVEQLEAELRHTTEASAATHKRLVEIERLLLKAYPGDRAAVAAARQGPLE